MSADFETPFQSSSLCIFSGASERTRAARALPSEKTGQTLLL